MGLTTWKRRSSVEIYFLCVFSLEEAYLTKIILALVSLALKKEAYFFFLTVIFGHLKINNNKKVIYFSCGALIAATFTF